MKSPYASNREFERFNQVRKEHTYRLAENESDEFDENYEVACLELADYVQGGRHERERFVGKFNSALSEIGFAVLTGHGVNSGLYRYLEARVVELFETTPLAEKMRFRAKRHGSINQGYFPLEQTSEIHPDLVEGWVWCRRAFAIPQRRNVPVRVNRFWPRAEFEIDFRRLVLAHEPLIKPIARAIFEGLGLDPNIYDNRLTGTNFGLRLNHYPQMTLEQDRSGAGRLLGHEDVDLFTLLPGTAVDGLQVWNHRTGKWIRLRAPAGSIIINVGDYLQRISNDILPSTTHRVGKPMDGSHLSQARVSFPMAVYLWEDELLQVLPGLGEPRYPAVRVIEFHTRSTSKFYGEDYAVKGPMRLATDR